MGVVVMLVKLDGNFGACASGDRREANIITSYDFHPSTAAEIVLVISNYACRVFQGSKFSYIGCTSFQQSLLSSGPA